MSSATARCPADTTSTDSFQSPQHVDESDAKCQRESRQAFMKLLRDGVQHKIDAELARNDPPTQQSAHTDNDPDSTIDHSNAHRHSNAAWRTLVWRDAYSTEPYFEATVAGIPLRIKQVLQGELNGFGTGLTVWPAACVLLKYLDHRFGNCNNNNNNQSPQLAGQSILELGSGTGAVGIAAAMLHAARVVLTDVDNIRFLLQANADAALAQLQQHSTTIIVDSYAWGTEPSNVVVPRAVAAAVESSDRITTDLLPDLILVSDCILPRLYPIEPLVAALDRLAGAHTRILVSYEQRYFAQFDPKVRFWSLMEARGFALRAIGRNEFHPQFVADDIAIWEIQRRSTACEATAAIEATE